MAKSLKDILAGVKSSKTVKGDVGGLTYPNDGNRDMVKDHDIEVHADRVGNTDAPYKSNKTPAKYKKSEKAQHGCTCGDQLTGPSCPMHGEAKVKKVDEAVGVSNDYRKQVLKGFKDGVNSYNAKSASPEKEKELEASDKRSQRKAAEREHSKDKSKSFSPSEKTDYRARRGDQNRMVSHTKKSNSVLRAVAKMKGVKEETVLEAHKNMDGEEVKVGSHVGFKDGVEQSGKVHSISPEGHATIHVWNSDTGEHDKVIKHVKRTWNEEVEQIDELSDRKLKSYVDKAEGDVSDKKSVAKQAANLKGKYEGTPMAKSADRVAAKYSKKADSRFENVKKAKAKLGEEAEQIDEISKGLARRYVDKIRNRDANRKAAGLDPIDGQYGDKHDAGTITANKKIAGKGVKVPATDKKKD